MDGKKYNCKKKYTMSVPEKRVKLVIKTHKDILAQGK
jgi:hypothetical protein